MTFQILLKSHDDYSLTHAFSFFPQGDSFRLPSFSSLEPAVPRLHALPTPCSRSNRALFRQDAALAHLDSLSSHDLVTWTNGSVPCIAIPVCSSFSTGPSTILQAFRWSQQHQQVCHFFCSSSFQTIALFLLHIPIFLPFCLTLSGASGRKYRFSTFFSIRPQRVPGHSFLPGNDKAIELATRGALLQLSTVPCNLSSLTSRIHSSLLSEWRPTVSFSSL